MKRLLHESFRVVCINCDKMKDEKPGIFFKIMRVISLTTLLLWPLFIFLGIFLFDNPNNSFLFENMVFLGIISYPFLIIGNVILSNKIYKKYRIIAFSLLLWPPLVFGFYTWNLFS